MDYKAIEIMLYVILILIMALHIFSFFFQKIMYNNRAKKCDEKTFRQYILQYFEVGELDKAIKLYMARYHCDYDEAFAGVGEIERMSTVCDILASQGTDNINYSMMSGRDFEYFCAEVLKRVGYCNVTVTPGSGDQGVDIVAEKDSVKYAIQCKDYSSPLGNTPIQEVCAGKMMYKCNVGVVMTNSTFTPKAKELAEATGTLLWDGVVLNHMVQNANLNEII